MPPGRGSHCLCLSALNAPPRGWYPAATRTRRRFCPNTNNILYPKVDAENKKLKFSCRISNYEEEVAPEEYCVSRRMINHSVAEQTTFVGNVKNDPTLPRTRDVVCPSCGAKEAVYFSVSTPEGMLLKFQCVSCGGRWNDSV